MTRQAGEVRVRRLASPILAGIAGVLLCVGCAKILGDFSQGPDAPEAGAGGSNVNDAGRVDARADAPACAEGATMCQAQNLLTCFDGTFRSSKCPFVCIGGSCVGICVPGDKGCQGAALRTCQTDGTWGTGAPCTSGICIGGQGTDAGTARCVGTCSPGMQTCTGPTTLGTCDQNGQLQSAQCPFVCTPNGDTGACGGVCVPDSLRCNGKQPEQCAADGTWAAKGSACPNECMSGTCVGMCSGTATQCNGNTVQNCMNGMFVDSATPCQFGCYNGACISCTPGSTSCLGNVVETCQVDGGQSLSPCTFQCADGGCVGECAPGTTRCAGSDGQTLQRCTQQSQWLDLQVCTFPCTMGACPGVCTPGMHRCNPSDNTPQVCDTTGTWVMNGSCPAACIGAGLCAGADGG